MHQTSWKSMILAGNTHINIKVMSAKVSGDYWSFSSEEHFRAAHQVVAEKFSLDHGGGSATAKTNVASNRASRTGSDCGNLALNQNELKRKKNTILLILPEKCQYHQSFFTVSSSSGALFVFYSVFNCALRNFWSLKTCLGLFYRFSKNNVSIGTALPPMCFCIN